jgi:large subunit ribosomal protein L24e
MPICSFTGEEIPKGKGVMYVKKDGTIYYFKNSKARKNFLNLKREGRRQKWTQASRDFKASQAKRKESKKVK